jgi:hypothetical protein
MVQLEDRAENGYEYDQILGGGDCRLQATEIVTEL